MGSESEHNGTSTVPTGHRDISAGGDVVFVVGEKQLDRFRVSSAIMKNASKVFEAMLSPGFAEGNTLLRSKQVEVPLPDDDVDGMFLILCVLHFRNDLVPETLGPRKIYNVAVLADKYDLFVPLKFAGQHWLSRARQAPPRLQGWWDGSDDDAREDERLWQLICAAYLLNDKKAFSEVTRSLVMHHV